MALAKTETCDARCREGLVTYLRCLLALLEIHHKTEDELAFPQFRQFRQLVEAPYDLLTEQHRALEPLLAEAKAEVEKAAVAPGDAESWTKLAVLMRRIQELWRPHIAIEEEQFTVNRFAFLAEDEHKRLSAQFMQHTRENTGPDYLMVPFLLFNLPAERRTFFTGAMPPVVIERLVPIEWKEKWAPMQPFLLA